MALARAALEALEGATSGVRTAGADLGGEPLAAGDAALAFSVFPGLLVEVILWSADEEFPAQVPFTVPPHAWRNSGIWMQSGDCCRW